MRVPAQGSSKVVFLGFAILSLAVMASLLLLGFHWGPLDKEVATSLEQTPSPTLAPGFPKIDTSEDDSSTFFVGGVTQLYLVERVWGGHWQQVDPLMTLHRNGVEWVQVRLTTVSNSELRDTPPEEWGNLPGAWWEYFHDGTLEYVEQILKEASDIGMRPNLVFLLSDRGAYAGLQETPLEWQDLSLDKLAVAVQDYCYETTRYFVDKGLSIEIYDIGNEIEMGILDYLPGDKVPLPEGVDPSTDMDYMKNNVWNIEAPLLKSCISGVKEADPDAKITLHATGLQAELLVKTFFQTMVEQGVEFDYAGLTFPPANRDWFVRFHDDPFSWVQPIIDFSDTLGKKVIFSEFTYPNDPKGIGSIPWNPPQPVPTPPKWESHVPVPGYPFTPEGQARWVRDFLSFCRNSDVIIGAFYYSVDFFPEMCQEPVQCYHPDEYLGVFASDTQIQPALLQFTSAPPSYPTVDLVDETNADEILVNETDASFTWSEHWGSDSHDCHVGGMRKFSAEPGAKVDIQFTGTAISLIYHESPDHGVAEIAVDGVHYPDVDMYAPEGRCQAEKVMATDLAPSEHVLTVTVSGRKNLASSGTLIVVDAVRVLQGTSPSPFLWSGDWELDMGGGYSGGTRMGSSEFGARASITFTGTGIALIYATSNDHGIAAVGIDGFRYPDIDMYSPEFVFRVTDVIATDLPPSEHVLTITVSGDKNPSSSDDFVVVDAVDVIQARPVPTDWIYLPIIMKSYQSSR